MSEKKAKKIKLIPGVIELEFIDGVIFAVLILLFLALYLPRLNFTDKKDLIGDEFYYVPAARTYLTPDKLDTNEIHPPLGKIFIALSIAVFGDKPPGWRYGPLLFGLISILLVYLFGVALFKNRLAATAAALLLYLDFLHFVQSRIATLDIFTAFFILLAVFFAYIYTEKFDEEKPVLNLWTVLSAIAVGLAAGTKLNGFSALPAIFLYFIAFFFLKKKNGKLKKLVLLGCLYVSIAMAVYFLTFIPLLIKGMEPVKMLPLYAYITHYRVKMEHRSLGPMWQWILLLKSHFYFYSNNEKAKTLQVVIAYGNFTFWWGFLAFFPALIYKAFKEKQKKYFLIIAGYLGTYLFWLSSFQIIDGKFSFKGGFIYYMLPCVPFMAFAVAEFLKDAAKSTLGKITMGLYFAGILYFWSLFYPLLTGIIRNYSYFNSVLRMDLLNAALAVGFMSGVVLFAAFMKKKNL